MKKGFLLLVLCALLILGISQGSAEPAPADRSEVHGMLVFGEEEIYLSHLPMFHAPHHYQIILAANLGKDTKATYLKSRKEHPEERVYTLEPSPFILPEMVRNPKPFTATLYRGHFERGGIPIAHDTTVKIKRVVFFEKLDSAAPKLGHLTYILFGNNKEWYLAHQIIAKPDFDQIVGITKHSGKLERQLKKDGKVFLTIANFPNNRPLKEDDERPAIVSGNSPLQIPLEGVKIYYLEFGDLAS